MASHARTVLSWSSMEPRILTVSQYIEVLNETLGMIPTELIVVGEVSQFSMSQQKWINFTLKDQDADAKIPCFMTVYQMKMPLEDGMKIQVRGRPNIYEKFGKFSFSISEYELVGEGALLKAYLMLKKKLEDEGLFDVSRKRQLPRFPERIGLITSEGAAAYGDFLRVLGNRFGGIEILHANVAVQGSTAVQDITQAFAQFESLPPQEKPQVLVLTRGGGSLEDLHAFNDEDVVRAIFRSSIPVIVGVGHERDESLCDFVADVRASTPSNAAERVTPDRREIHRELEMHLERMYHRVQMGVEAKNRSAEHAVLVLRQFIDRHVHMTNMAIGQFLGVSERFLSSVNQKKVETQKHARYLALQMSLRTRTIMDRLSSRTHLLESFRVERVLQRGFSLVRMKNKIIRAGDALAPGDRIAIQFAHGDVSADVVHGAQEKLL